MTRRTFALSLAASTALRAETGKERGKRLIGQVVQGLGGEAFRRMQTRTEIGRAYSFYREQISGLSVAHLYTKYRDTADGKGLLQVERQVFGKKLEDAVIFTPTESYDVTYRGAQPLGEEKFNQYRETTLHDVFYILRERLNEPGMEFEGTGKDVVENQPVETIEIYDSDNRNVTVWVNQDTFVPVKQRFYRWDETIKDRHEEVTRYTKYREVNGVMWPFSITRERDGGRNFQLYSEHVTINDALADSMFELPTGVKILKR
jgi:hypothetical protein